MSEAYTKDFDEFVEGYEMCQKSFKTGGVAIDPNCIRRLIRNNPSGALQFIKYCRERGKSEAGYLDIADMVAVFYSSEFK